MPAKLRISNGGPWPYLMLAPFLLASAAFGLWPVVRTIALSLDGGGTAYGQAVSDPLLWLAAANTVGFSVVFAIGQAIVATAAALLIDALPRRMGGLMATLCFATHLLGGTFAGVLFAAMLSGRTGLVNALLLRGGVIDAPVPWLTTPNLAMPVLLAVAIYVGFGFGTIYLLAALRRVDRELLDAARVDGAGLLRRLTSVTLPQLRPTLSILLIGGLFWGLSAFELPFVLFDGAGPGYRVLTVVMLVFAAAFERGEVAYASAVATLLAATTAVFVTLAAAALGVGREEVSVG